MSKRYTSVQYKQIMEEIFLANITDYKEVLTPKYRVKCYDLFKEKTGKSDYTAKNFFNQVLNDFRRILPAGEIAMGTIAKAEAEMEELNELIAELKDDVKYLKGEAEKHDSSMAMTEDESAFMAKSKIREQLLKAIDIKSGITSKLGDFAMKLYKVNTDRDKNDIMIERNKITAKQSEIPDFGQLTAQYQALQNLQKGIAEKYQLTASHPTINSDFKVTVIEEEEPVNELDSN